MIVLFLVFVLVFASLVICKSDEYSKDSSKSSDSVFIPDIIIPDDYYTIQEGIKNAHPGDTIFVKEGTYKENLIVNKKNLQIIGENKYNTVLDGNKKTHVVNIVSSNVTIKGFTIRNGWNENENLWDISGVRINASNVKIIGNIIKSNRLGVTVITKTYNHTIIDNEFIGDGLLFGNYVYNNYMTIEDYIHTVENNTVNGKSLVYIKNQRDFTISSNAGQVILVNCTNIVIKNLNIKNTDFPIILAGCKDCLIENNKIDEIDGELILFLSENNTIRKNTISNGLHGICLDYGSKNNIIENNTVTDNWVGISSLTKTSNNIIRGNFISRNIVGLELTTYYLPLECYNNIVVNNFIKRNRIGIEINEYSHHHILMRNTIVSNIIYGIFIKNSNNITIKNNNFKNNLIFDSTFVNSDNNIWYNNYWNRPRVLPKVIFGYKKHNNLFIPWINIDNKPAMRTFGDIK